MGRRGRRGRCTLGCGSLRGGGGRRCGELGGGVWQVRRDGGREVVLGGGGQGTSGDGVGLLRLLSVVAPAVGGGGRGTSTEAPAQRLHEKKKKTSSDGHSAHRTYPVGENSGAPHSESTPKPKSDLKNKRLTPTILMTLRSLDKSKLNARPHRRSGSPCFRRLLSAGAWLCHRWPPGRLDLVLIQASTYQEW